MMNYVRLLRNTLKNVRYPNVGSLTKSDTNKHRFLITRPIPKSTVIQIAWKNSIEFILAVRN